MTKRFGDFDSNIRKRFKNAENLDDLWGDDLDAKDVEDCFMLASQVCEQDNVVCTQRNNVSILPSYNAFKQNSEKKFTSTQSDSNIPSTSGSRFTDVWERPQNMLSMKKEISNNYAEINGFKRTRSFESPNHLPNTESKYKKLEEQYIAKVGEVSILRTQLKDSQASKEVLNAKKQKEWTDKLSDTTKRLNAVKSELEFKNLEIANLKQKVIEVAKNNNVDTTLNLSQSPFFKPRIPEKYSNSPKAVTSLGSSKKEPSNDDWKIHPTVNLEYPLNQIIPASAFSFQEEEKYIVDFKDSQTYRNTIPFLKNQKSQEMIEKLIRLQPKETALNNHKLKFDFLYCDVVRLSKCTKEELDAENYIPCINKIVCVSEQLMMNLYQFLQEFSLNSQNENSERLNTVDLGEKLKSLQLELSVLDAQSWCDGEVGASARQSIAFIAEVVPYNSYLRGYLLKEKPLIFKEELKTLRNLPSVQEKLEKKCLNKFDYINLISSVVKTIRKLKKSNDFPGVLSAIAVLLSRISSCENLGQINNLMLDITRNFVFCGPNIQIILHLTDFLKNVTRHNSFVQELCKMPPSAALKVNQKEKILYYSEDSCLLQVLCILLENNRCELRTWKLQLYLNIVESIFNILRCNPKWMFYQEEKYCNCLSRIFKLYVDIMYEAVETLNTNPSTYKNDINYNRIFRTMLEILHILNFKAFDLIVKYIASYAKIKDTVMLMLQLKTELNLDESDSFCPGLTRLASILETLPVVHFDLNLFCENLVNEDPFYNKARHIFRSDLNMNDI